MYLIFSILKNKKLVSNKRVRRVAKSIHKHRLKYMIFHDAFWVTYLYATFMALLQFSQASTKTAWDSVNILLAAAVLILNVAFMVVMIYLGNKYKNHSKEGKKIPTKLSFLKMES